MSKKQIYVALIDSGCSFETYEKIAITVENKQTQVVTPKEARFKHGDAVGAIIMKVQNIALYDIQVFDKSLHTTPYHIKGALEYLLDKKIDVIHMSLGLKTNYLEIERLCKQLIAKGAVIIASFPKAGADFVFPASYEDVISVTSDGECNEEKLLLLDEERLLFAANPFSKVEGVGGSSIAVAKFTKIFCEYLAKGYTKEESLSLIKQRCKNE